MFIGRTHAEDEPPLLWPPAMKSWLIGKDPDAEKDWGQEEKLGDTGWDGWMASPTQWTRVWPIQEDCERQGRVAKSWTQPSNWTTTSSLKGKKVLKSEERHQINELCVNLAIIQKESDVKCSVQFSHSVVSDSLRLHESQHARPPCPTPSPRVYSNSCPSSQWCHPAISSTVVPFSSYPKSLPASGSEHPGLISFRIDCL